MNKIILLVFIIFIASCTEDKSNNNSDDKSKRNAGPISFANRITRHNIDRFISRTEIDGLSCTVLDVSESNNKIIVNMELSLSKSSNFIYNELVLSVNLGVHSVDIPFHEFYSDGVMVKKVALKLSLDISEDLTDDSRPFVSIAGSVSENLGNGILGKSTSVFNVWDLMGNE